MPRKEYKTITVKAATFQRFQKAVHGAKKANPDIDNSKFLESLLNYKKRIPMA